MSNSTSSSAKRDDERTQELRKKARRFRILIVGRANSGKTTILQKICKTDEEPEIFNSKGEKIDLDVVQPSAGRGIHDIENEMIFRSNQGFVFHDSRGFEAGGATELDDVKKFIKQRAKERKLPDQIHAIWYCIPMDSPRPVTKAEEDFFSKVGTGKVIVVFTKFDAKDDEAYGALKEEGLSQDDAVNQAPSRAMQDFQKIQKDLSIFKSRYSPTSFVVLRDMNLSQSHCNKLVEETAAALDQKILQALFVSTQRNQIELCFKYALQESTRITTQAKLCASSITFQFLVRYLMDICWWFPYSRDQLLWELDWRQWLNLWLWRDRLLWERDNPLVKLVSNLSTQQQSKLINMIQASSKLHTIIQLGIAYAILAEYSFFHSPQELAQMFTDLESSSQWTAIKEAVNQLNLKGRSRITQAMLKEKILQIALDNRLVQDT